MGSNTKYENERAFPLGSPGPLAQGLTKLEYFTGQALAGLSALELTTNDTVSLAVEVARAVCKELDR